MLPGKVRALQRLVTLRPHRRANLGQTQTQRNFTAINLRCSVAVVPEPHGRLPHLSKQTVKAFFEAVVKGHASATTKLQLTGEYQPMDYCVQYRETDLNFLTGCSKRGDLYFSSIRTANTSCAGR